MTSTKVVSRVCVKLCCRFVWHIIACVNRESSFILLLFCCLHVLVISGCGCCTFLLWLAVLGRQSRGLLVKVI